MEYTPPQHMLDAYAAVLVGLALGHGRGVRPGESVLLRSGAVAAPLTDAVSQAVRAEGGRVTDTPDGADHLVIIRVDEDYAGPRPGDPASWTTCLYGTEELAQRAGTSLAVYWQEIARGCLLGEEDAVAAWREVITNLGVIKDTLRELEIERLHVEGADADLWVSVTGGEWVTTGGVNLPSFEVFCRPDWATAEGWIRFSEPVHRPTGEITGIELRFNDGHLSRAGAEVGEERLSALVDGEDLGRLSLTDRRISTINRFMANALFDANVGGRYGNCHVSLGTSALISRRDRTVTASLGDGSERVIYAGGQFAVY